jgi:hypothetical protein
MTQFTCKGVKQINNRISFKHLHHSYLSAFFISTGVPNGEFPEILIAKCRSRFYCTWFFVGGILCGRKRCVREINVSRAWDPVHTGDKALTWETPAKRGRVNRYAIEKTFLYLFYLSSIQKTFLFLVYLSSIQKTFLFYFICLPDKTFLYLFYLSSIQKTFFFSYFICLPYKDFYF